MRLFIVGITAFIVSLYFNAESDPLYVKSSIAKYTGAAPIDAFASSHAIINDVSMASDVEMSWDNESSIHFQRVNMQLSDVQDDLNSLCEQADDEFRATPEFEIYCNAH